MIITFYSFKGGVGRSMALANVANWLRLENLRVAVIDWDLEAPGLENFFVQSAERRAEVLAAPGLIDLLVSYKERFASLPAEFFAAAGESPTPAPPPLERRVGILRTTLPPLASLMLDVVPENQSTRADGKLSLLAPGMRDNERRYSYARDVQGFNWSELYGKYDGGVLFAWMRAELERDFDVTLIDSRTGITEVGGVCTREMADLVVTLCAANDQNLNGSALVVRSLFREELISLRGGRKLRAAMVPARYDNGETTHLLAFQQRFAAMTRELNLLEKDESWRGLDPEVMWELRVPYTPKYAYQERLCVGASDANPDLLARYEKLAEFVAKAYLDGLSEEARARVTAASPHFRKVADASAPAETMEAVLERAYGSLSDDARAVAPSLLTRFVGFTDPEDATSLVLQSRMPNDFPERDEKHLSEFIRVHLLAPASTRTQTQQAQQAQGPEHGRCRLPYPGAENDWGRLKQWIEDDLDFLMFRDELRQRMEHAAHESQSHTVLSSPFRARAERFASRRADLCEAELKFLDARLMPRPWWRAPLAYVAAVAFFSIIIGFVVFDPYSIARPAPSASVSSMPSLPPTPAELADAKVSTAREHELVGDVDGALRAYSEAIDLYPKVKEAFVGRGRLLFRAQRFDVAEQDFKAASQLDPGNPALLFQLGQAQARQGTTEPAIKNLREAVAAVDANPKSDRKASAAAYAELAEALRSQSRFDEALSAYKEAVARDGDMWDAYYGRALTYIQVKQTALATEDLQTVATRSIDPALRDSAVARLKDLGVKRLPATTPAGEARRVFVQYVSSTDKPTIDNLLARLANKQRNVPGAELTRPRTTGDVRSFFPQDREAATTLKQDTERALAELGYDIKLSQLDLDSKAFPLAQQGTIELWLPALSSYVRPPATPKRCYVDPSNKTLVLPTPPCASYSSALAFEAWLVELRAFHPECGEFRVFYCDSK